MPPLRWVRFVDQFPPPDHPHWAICTHADGEPLFYHWFIDGEGRTEMNSFYWLQGYRLPPVPVRHSDNVDEKG